MHNTSHEFGFVDITIRRSLKVISEISPPRPASSSANYDGREGPPLYWAKAQGEDAKLRCEVAKLRCEVLKREAKRRSYDAKSRSYDAKSRSYDAKF